MVQADPLNAQRRFCSRTLAKMIRLCAQLRYVQQKVLPADERWLQLIPASDQPTAPPPDPGAPGGLQPPYGALMEAVVAKTSEVEVEERLRAVAADIDGGLQAALKVFMHVLLVRASVSQYHTEVLLDRYQQALANIMASVWPGLLALLRRLAGAASARGRGGMCTCSHCRRAPAADTAPRAGERGNVCGDGGIHCVRHRGEGLAVQQSPGEPDDRPLRVFGTAARARRA